MEDVNVHYKQSRGRPVSCAFEVLGRSLQPWCMFIPAHEEYILVRLGRGTGTVGGWAACMWGA